MHASSDPRVEARYVNDKKKQKNKKTQTFFSRCIGFLVLMQKNMMISLNKIMILISVAVICIPVGNYHQGWEKLSCFWSMHWVFGFDATNPFSVNKAMVLFQLLSYVIQSAVIIEGGRNPTFFGRCIGFLILMQQTRFLRIKPWFCFNFCRKTYCLQKSQYFWI